MYCLTQSTNAIRWVNAEYEPANGEQLLGSVVFYSNDGLSFERTAAEHSLQEGEAFFTTIQAPDALAQAFPNYATALQAKTNVPLALAALAKSDAVFIRCAKASVAWPSEWQAYVTALRSIASTGSGTLPEQPDYPLGT